MTSSCLHYFSGCLDSLFYIVDCLFGCLTFYSNVQTIYVDVGQSVRFRRGNGEDSSVINLANLSGYYTKKVRSSVHVHERTHADLVALKVI